MKNGKANDDNQLEEFKKSIVSTLSNREPLKRTDHNIQIP